MPVSRDDVVWGYRMILGREPESEDVVRHHMATADVADLRRILLDSGEFKASEKIPDALDKWIWTDVLSGRRGMWLNLADKYVSFGCLIDNYEPEETKVFRSLCKPGMTVVDVGANIGWFTLIAADLVGEGGRVISIEPNRVVYDYLNRTISGNKLDHVVATHNLALGAREGTATLAWPSGPKNLGNAHLVDVTETTQTHVVEVRTLDQVISQGKCDVIKIDIEGAEPLALFGSTQTMRASRPTILCEINPQALLRVSKVDIGSFFNQMRSVDYDFFRLDQLNRAVEAVSELLPGEAELINVVLRPKQDR